MSSRKWTAAVLAAACIAGCSPPPQIVRERTLGSEEVLARVAERNRRITTLRGEGSITIESPERSNNGGFDLNLRKPDSVCVEFSGPFGIRVGTLMLARDQFVFYNFLDNRAIVGEPDGTSLGAMFNITMRFDEILGAFTGEFGGATESDTLERFSVEGGMYVVLYRNGGRRKECRIDGDTFVVTSYRALDENGKAEITAFASEVELAGETAMPRLLRIVFPAERRSITIAYDDVEVNERVDCTFALPEQAEIHYR